MSVCLKAIENQDTSHDSKTCLSHERVNDVSQMPLSNDATYRRDQCQTQGFEIESETIQHEINQSMATCLKTQMEEKLNDHGLDFQQKMSAAKGKINVKPNVHQFIKKMKKKINWEINQKKINRFNNNLEKDCIAMETKTKEENKEPNQVSTLT